MNTVLNIAAGIVSAVVVFIWLRALFSWDGEHPCEQEDCEGCLYRGTGCNPNKNHSKKGKLL